jgi:hypothetical protein
MGQAELPDEAFSVAVLSRLLLLHPDRRSAEELQREMLAGRQGFARSTLTIAGPRGRRLRSAAPCRRQHHP